MANPVKHSNNPVREHIKMAEAGAKAGPCYWAESTHGRGSFFFFPFNFYAYFSMLICTISWDFSLIISLAFWGHKILSRLIEKIILSGP